MVVDVSPLTEAQKQRLKKIPNNCREDGKEDDDERLCNSWKGALPEDKLELEKLVTDGDLAGKLSSKKVREEHPKFRIYTVACVQNAIGNCRRKVAKAAKERQTSKFQLCLTNVVHLMAVVLTMLQWMQRAVAVRA